MRLQTRVRRIRRRFTTLFSKRNRQRTIAIAAVIIMTAAGGIILIVQNNHDRTATPAAYRALLDTIAEGESSGNYNAYFGNAANNDVRFTDMTINQVLTWQAEYVRQGSVSSAVGRYQIIRPTLIGLVRQLQLAGTEKYDAAMQDRLAITLIERRGAIDFLNERISRDQFAANLSEEWAALPRAIGANPGESFYASDGINASRIGLDEIRRRIDELFHYNTN